MHDDSHSVAEHLKQLRTYAYHTIHFELIEGRKVLWRQELNCAQDLPDWMTLMAPDDLKNLSKQVILKDMKCVERSCQAFVATVKKKSKKCYAEACKVLAHLIK